MNKNRQAIIWTKVNKIDDATLCHQATNELKAYFVVYVYIHFKKINVDHYHLYKSLRSYITAWLPTITISNDTPN